MKTVVAGRAAAGVFGVIAVAWMPVGPALSADAYQKALQACWAAAEAAEIPTDFKCDWKTVTRGAPGGALTGKYTFKEQGLTGDMTIVESPGKPAVVGIETVSNDPNAHNCTAAFDALREGDELTAKPEDSEGCEITIKSGSKPNIVEVMTNDACSYYCGMRATIAGKWKLISR